MSLLCLPAHRGAAARRSTQWCRCLLCMVVASCAREESRRYAGHHVSGFEVSSLTPCRDQDEFWWVGFDERAHEKYDSPG